jgi:fumarate reductase flavoprotein subunit
MADVSAADVAAAPAPRADAEADVVVVGAGACGLTAALRAHERGRSVIIVERDASPYGSTSMSSGFVPAAGTCFQRRAGVADDSPDRLFADIMAKSGGNADAALARLAAERIGPAATWLAEACGIEWIVLTDFLYPGHSRRRMHAVPEKTGTGLLQRLLNAVEERGIALVCQARATRLYTEGRHVKAVAVARPDGKSEVIACKALILACNGYGGNRDLVRRHIPQMADALYFGHAGNTGDALAWGAALGAGLKHLSGYQGHGSLAHPHGILITWALMMEGAIQVNAKGRRFSNEHGGYSEQATKVLAEPGGIAWTILDTRLAEFAGTFPDFAVAREAGALIKAQDEAALAGAIGAEETVLTKTLDACRAHAAGRTADPFGRDFTGKPALRPPYLAVKVTGALFHTQGGLTIDANARVTDAEGHPFPNLHAGGGAACGVSGPNVSGYLSGNGLLTAIAFGDLAGANAAE